MPAASGAFVAAYKSRVSANGTNLTMTDWTGTYKGEDLPVTNFESAVNGVGYAEGIIGIFSFDWNLSGSWNANQNPTGSPPTLYPTDSGLNLNFFTNKAVQANYLLANYRCFQGAATATVNGTVTFTANGQSQGQFTVQ